MREMGFHILHSYKNITIATKGIRMERLNTELDDIKANCKFLVEMVPGGKPYSDRLTGEICVGNPGKTQGMWRYALGESKETCISYATIAIVGLQQYLDHYIEYIRWHVVTEEARTLYSNIAEVVMTVDAGLQHLVDTYDSDTDIVAIKDRFSRAIDMFAKGCQRFASLSSSFTNSTLPVRDTSFV
mgnify:FL=1